MRGIYQPQIGSVLNASQIEMRAAQEYKACLSTVLLPQVVLGSICDIKPQPTPGNIHWISIPECLTPATNR